MTANVQLLAFHFEAGAPFEGQLVGALERAESGGALRVRDVLFVGSDPESGELVAVSAHGGSQGAVVSKLLGFRLDPAERRRATERALQAYDAGGDEHPIHRIAAALPPGGALAAVLVEHVWAGAVDDAVARTGGAALERAWVAQAELAALSSELIAAVERAAPGPAQS